MSDVLIIGGGAAGLFCAARLSEAGVSVTVLEKNEKPGKKLYITGKGRCNFTNACSREEFLAHVVRNDRFLMSASAGLDPSALLALFSRWGLAWKVERGSRAFPESDHASDVTKVLEETIRRNGGTIRLHTKAEEILTGPDGVRGVRVSCGGKTETIRTDTVVVATGGLSYPTTGSDGDGHAFARKADLTVTDLSPSLVPVNCADEVCKALQGLSLKNVTLRFFDGDKELWSGFGELLFTHFGISGPLVLTASALIGEQIQSGRLRAEIDLKSAITEEELDARLIRLFAEKGRTSVRNMLQGFCPGKLIPVLPEIAGIDGEKRACDLGKKERAALLHATKHFPLHPVSLRSFREAVITRGGVSVKEINPKTMETKKEKGLYFIGEVLDTDALTGGFNLQIAWCTAEAAAAAIAAEQGMFLIEE